MSALDISNQSNNRNLSWKVDRNRQWTLQLATATSAYLLFMTLSGLSLWLLPFSVPSQILVFVHTVVGVVLFLPVSWYNLRHWLVYRRHQMAHIILLGYVGVVAVVVCNVSGLVLTEQALFGRAISYSLDTIHTATTSAIVGFVLPHIVLIAVRDGKAQVLGILEAVKWHGRRVAMYLLALLASCVLIVYASQPPRLSVIRI